MRATWKKSRRIAQGCRRPCRNPSYGNREASGAMNQSDNEQRRRRIRSRPTRAQPSQGAGSMDVELATLIEEHLPLVKHVVFQVAVQFPATSTVTNSLVLARRPGRGGPSVRRSSRRTVRALAAQRIRGAILDAVRAADWAPRSLRTLARQPSRPSSSWLPSWVGCPTETKCRGSRYAPR